LCPDKAEGTEEADKGTHTIRHGQTNLQAVCLQIALPLYGLTYADCALFGQSVGFDCCKCDNTDCIGDGLTGH